MGEVNNLESFTAQKEISKIDNFSKVLQKIKIIIVVLLLLLIIMVLILIYLINKINNSSNLTKEVNTLKKNYDLDRIDSFNYQKKISKYLNLTHLDFQEEIKQGFLNFLSQETNKKITHIKTFHLLTSLRFGNSILALNKEVFFCGLVGCENIAVEPKNWYITHPVYIKEINSNILPYKEIDCSEEGVICLDSQKFYFYKYKYFLPTLNFSLFSDEIYRNIPKFESSSNDLYIHLRSEDVFTKNNIHTTYAQPPFCFYQKIIESKPFENIFIFSNGRENPVIQKLIDTYPGKIKFKFGALKDDIGELAHAKNLVLSTSSFVIGIARFSKSLQNLYYYDMIVPREKESWLINEDIVENRNINVHIMIPSKYYMDNIYPWHAHKNQLELMLTEKCEGDFFIKTSL